MVAVACPVPTAAQVRPAASSALGWVAAVQTARAPTGLSLTGAEQIDLVRRIAEAAPGRATCSGKVIL
jgi:hypothetical protein